MAKAKKKTEDTKDKYHTKKILDDEKLNIMLLGNSGAGKSTLINAFLNTDVEKAEEGTGEATTKHIQVYGEDSGLNFRLIDTPGFEYSKKRQNSIAKEIIKWLKIGIKNSDPQSIVHAIWFCVDGQSAKMPKDTLSHLRKVSKYWEKVPIIMVITKSYFAEDKTINKEMIEEVLHKQKDDFNIKEIVPVVAKKKENVETHGLDILTSVTERYGPEAKEIFEKNWREKTCARKRVEAQKIIFTRAGTAVAADALKKKAGVGKVVTPIQRGMLEQIAQVYEIENNDTIKIVADKLIAANAIGIIGKKIADKATGFFKGKAKIAAKVITSSVSGTVTIALGEVGVLVYESIYKGEVDTTNIDWEKYIDKILKDNSLGEKINTLISAIRKKDADTILDEIVDMDPNRVETKGHKTNKKNA